MNMMGGMDHYYSGYTKTIDTLNKLAGLNKENIKWWLQNLKIKGEEKKVSDDFAEKVASLAIATPYRITKAILNEYYNLCIMGINPEESPTFWKKMITGAMATHIFTLLEKSSDLSLRASTAKQRKEGIESSEVGF